MDVQQPPALLGTLVATPAVANAGQRVTLAYTVQNTGEATALAVIPADRGTPAAQDRGRLLPMRGRLGRSIDGLARRLTEGSSAKEVAGEGPAS